MRKRKKSTQQKKFIPRPDRPKEARAKERERMAEALAAYQGPITKCPPGIARDRALSASNRAAKRQSLAQPRQPAFSHTLVFDLDQPTGQLFTTTLSSA